MTLFTLENIVVVETDGIVMICHKNFKKRGLKTDLSACRKKKFYTTHIKLYLYL
jgi:hypothetical protein